MIVLLFCKLGYLPIVRGRISEALLTFEIDFAAEVLAAPPALT